MAIDVSNIIPPVDRDLLESELTSKVFLRKTNKADNEIYVIDHKSAPNVLKEIGRLRELSFRLAGGGTGEPMDLDSYDTSKYCYKQLIVYSPEDREIVGGYRFIKCIDSYNPSTGKTELSTLHYFSFTNHFNENYFPYTIELGRSWVQPKFQASVNRKKGIFALDNLWDGLGAIVKQNSDLKYLYGKVTMYPDYNKTSRDAILFFLKKYFPDKNNMARPLYPLQPVTNGTIFESLFANIDFKEASKKLTQFVKEHEETVPPLINAYMNLSDSMKTFGTAVNPDFGGVEETGILITISDIHQAKRERHIESYKP